MENQLDEEVTTAEIIMESQMRIMDESQSYVGKTLEVMTGADCYAATLAEAYMDSLILTARYSLPRAQENPA